VLLISKPKQAHLTVVFAILPSPGHSFSKRPSLPSRASDDVEVVMGAVWGGVW
jgi:hypothetical protein